MAAVLEPTAERVAGAVREKVDAFADEPLLVLARGLLKWGAVVAFIGGVMWLVGRLAAQGAQAAAADEVKTVESIVGQFSNAGPAAGTIGSAVNAAVGSIFSGVVVVKVTTGQSAYASLVLVQVKDASGNVLDNTTALVALSWYHANGSPYTVGGGKTALLGDATLWDPTNRVFWGGATPDGGVAAGDYVQVVVGNASGVSTYYAFSAKTSGWDGNAPPSPVGSNKMVLAAAAVLDASSAKESLNYAWDTYTIPSGKAVTPTGSSTTAVPSANPFAVLAGDLAAAQVSIGTVVGDLPKALLLTLSSLPRMLWDGLVAVVGGGLGSVFQSLGPLLLVTGIALLVGGYLLKTFGLRLAPRLELGMNARTASLWNRFDRWFHTRQKIQEVWTQKSTEGMIWSANEKPLFIAPDSREAKEYFERTAPPSPRGKPEPGTVTPKKGKEPPKGPEGGDGPPPQSSDKPPTKPASPDAPGTARAPPADSPPVQDPTDKPPEKPVPGGATTAEVEAKLGEVPYSDAKKKLAAAVKAKREETFSEMAEARKAEDRKAALAEMRRALAAAKTEREAREVAEESDRIAHEARASRDEARAVAKAMEKKGFAGKRYRGAFEGVNRGMHPEEYGD